MGKGSHKRPRAAHITKEQYDANYEAVFRSGTTEPGDHSDNGPDSEVLEESGGQPDREVESPVEEEKLCPFCKYPNPEWEWGVFGSGYKYAKCCGERIEG